MRPISTTPSRNATDTKQPTPTEVEAETDLDTLTNQPGVKYTVTESPESLQNLNTSNLSSLAHREIEQHKELREMVRLAAWEMPLLAQFAKPYEPPRRDQVLRWRYTTYLGESHPAARKVVVEFQPAKLAALSEEQRAKFLKLAGPRYNPTTQTVKMSYESFETQAQNKRYLADTINKLIAECKDASADSFADVPLDTRHHKPKIRHKFPQAWVLTAERKAELEGKRTAKMLEEGKKVEEDRLVSGVRAIEQQRKVDVKKAEEPVMVEARQPLAKGKMGRKEMGQQRVQRP